MPRAIRFQLDENCGPRIAVGLRIHGVDITTTVDVVSAVRASSAASRLLFSPISARACFICDRTHHDGYLRKKARVDSCTRTPQCGTKLCTHALSSLSSRFPR